MAWCSSGSSGPESAVQMGTLGFFLGSFWVLQSVTFFKAWQPRLRKYERQRIMGGPGHWVRAVRCCWVRLGREKTGDGARWAGFRHQRGVRVRVAGARRRPVMDLGGQARVPPASSRNRTIGRGVTGGLPSLAAGVTWTFMAQERTAWPRVGSSSVRFWAGHLSSWACPPGVPGLRRPVRLR